MIFLNNALTDFLNAIQNVWAPIFQMQGIQILLAIGAIAFAIYMIQLIANHDFQAFIMGFTYTVISLAVLHGVFLYSQTFATDILNGFLQWGQQVSGESPEVLTPSGIAQTGTTLAGIFWTAGGHASWFIAPISALEQLICSALVIVAFGIASIIYLLAQVEVWALIIGASVLLAFAPLPWTWSIFPGWGMSILSACVKLFFLLAVLALGLTEATNWTNSMSAVSGTIADNISLMMQATVEALLFLATVFYIPSLMSRLVVGASGPVLTAGEAFLGTLAGVGASTAMAATANAPRAAGEKTIMASQRIASMLLR